MKITPAINHSFVELYASDLKIVKDFYTKLGFKIVWEIDTYVVLKFDKSIIAFFKENFPEPRGVGIEIVIQVESQDIKDCYQKFLNLGIKINEPLTLQDYDKWDFRLHDPLGYYLRFTEPENILFC
jgi:predicted lactoylglutathione lyase